MGQKYRSHPFFYQKKLARQLFFLLPLPTEQEKNFYLLTAEYQYYKQINNDEIFKLTEEQTLHCSCSHVFARGFFEVYSLGVQFRMQQQISHLKQEIKRYQQEYSADSSAYENLLHDKESIETYVREHLYMKKANEDIFLIEELTPEDVPNP